jgi:hypothetical protein
LSERWHWALGYRPSSRWWWWWTREADQNWRYYPLERCMVHSPHLQIELNNISSDICPTRGPLKPGTTHVFNWVVSGFFAASGGKIVRTVYVEECFFTLTSANQPINSEYKWRLSFTDVKGLTTKSRFERPRES